MMKLTNKVIDIIKPRILHYNFTHNKFIKKSKNLTRYKLVH